MNYRFVEFVLIAIAVFCVSPLQGEDDPPAEPASQAVDVGESSGSAPQPLAEIESESELEKAGDSHSSPSEVAEKETGEGHTADEHEADGHGDEGHGDPHDLSHVNATDAMNSPQEFKSDLAIWTFVVFLCLLAVLGKFAWGPIMAGLEKREQSIAAMVEEAKQSQEKAAEQLKQYEAKIAAAGEESREIVAQARKDAEAAGERIVAAAEVAAEKQRERAVADITNAKNAALEEIKTEGVGLAVQLAGRIVRRELNAKDHSQLIDEALKQLPSRN